VNTLAALARRFGSRRDGNWSAEHRLLGDRSRHSSALDGALDVDHGHVTVDGVGRHRPRRRAAGATRLRGASCL